MGHVCPWCISLYVHLDARERGLADLDVEEQHARAIEDLARTIWGDPKAARRGGRGRALGRIVWLKRRRGRPRAILHVHRTVRVATLWLAHLTRENVLTREALAEHLGNDVPDALARAFAAGEAERAALRRAVAAYPLARERLNSFYRRCGRRAVSPFEVRDAIGRGTAAREAIRRAATALISKGAVRRAVAAGVGATPDAVRKAARARPGWRVVEAPNPYSAEEWEAAERRKPEELERVPYSPTVRQLAAPPAEPHDEREVILDVDPRPGGPRLMLDIDELEQRFPGTWERLLGVGP